jgi:DNA replication protein DnaC
LRQLVGPAPDASQEQEPDCPHCGGRGMVLDFERNVATPCACAEERVTARLLRSSGISAGFLSRTFDNFQTDGLHPKVAEAKASCQRYVREFPTIRNTEQNSVALLGDTGAGKTHLACAIGVSLVQNGHWRVRYFQHQEGMADLRANLDAKAQKVEALKHADLLIWDDLFKGNRVTDFEFEVCFEVINYRYFNRLPMVISSEMTALGLLEMDEALASRILERAENHLHIFELTPEERDAGWHLNYRLWRAIKKAR